tara:strand:+ start:168 stop:2975 length:2808 start_codon:yes stop_codon:yes gene_type:complete
MAANIPVSQFRSNNVRIITYDIINDVPVDERQLNFVKNIFRQYAGQTIQISKRYYNPAQNQFIDDTQIIEVPVRGFNSWWRIFSVFFFPDSDEWIFGESYNPANMSQGEQAQVLIMSADRVGTSNYEQFFLDGTSHCVFTPMMNWAIDRCIESKSKSAHSRYNSKAKKIEKYLTEYKDGVPARDFQKICNELQIGIEIDIPTSLISKDTEYIKVRSQKKPLKTFRFINTRLNHIELNEISSKDNYEEVSQDKLREIFDNTDFKLWRGDRETQLYQINTKDKIYKFSAEEGYHHEVQQFLEWNREDGNNLDECRIEHYSNEKLSQFLLDNVNRNLSLMFGCPWEEYTEEWNNFKDWYVNPEEMAFYENESIKRLQNKDYCQKYPERISEDENVIKVCDYIRSLDNLNHIDLQKAYTRGSECSFYRGYLGKITDFRRCDKIVGLGIYQINNIKNIPPLIKKLGVLYNNNSYPSPELEFYKSLGITFDIVCGCWGSRIDIFFGNEWDAGMFLKDEKGTPHYAKWYGCLMKLTTKERFNFDCKDLEFAKLNNISDNCDIRYNHYTDVGIIEYKKDKAKHSAHIASFIHTYSRISVIEQLMKFKDMSQIVAVEVDGIFYRGDVEIGDLFVSKPGKTPKHIQFDKYVSQVWCDPITDLPEYRSHNIREVHIGPGGAGKTHNNLIDKGLLYPLYVAPSWKLSRNKSSEYNIESSVYYYLICDDPEVYRPIQRNYNTLIIDEISMLSNENKNLILKRFKNHKIIFCGDLRYQLPPVEGYEFTVGNLPVFKHTKNYRCQCKKLLKILTKMRQLLAKDIIDIDTKQILTKFGFTIEKKEDMDYKVEDLIITKTHKTKDIYTEKYKDLKKYQVKENTLDYSNGEIIIGDKPVGVNSVLQHAFTIHSIQGETCKDTLFIDINKMSCLRMLYTALSRAKLFSQIKIIE